MIVIYFTVQEMCKLFNLNRQTLYFYDKKNILVPEYRDELNGYRKYSTAQINSLAMICYLRKVGFSLEQIRQYVNASNSEEKIIQLKSRSERLKFQYSEILKLDNAVMRRIEFVENKLEESRNFKYTVNQYKKIAYFPLGTENSIYYNNIFYFFPTIAFYDRKDKGGNYIQTFGAYIDNGTHINVEDADKVKFISKGNYVRFFHKGAWKQIPQKIQSFIDKHPELNIVDKPVCFNIVDQFLDNNPNNFVTEIQLPLKQKEIHKIKKGW